MGFSASDYVLRSSSVVFTPLAALVLAALAMLLGYRIMDLYLTKAKNESWRRGLTIGVAIAAAVFLIAGAILLFEVHWLSQIPLVKPVVLSIGAVLAGYAAHLRRLPLGDSGASPSPVTSLYYGMLASLLVLALFWAASILAHDQGIELAHKIERDLPNRVGVVVYTHDRQDITGPGIIPTALDPTNSAYRFRYTGLRLLARTGDGGYVLLPRGWHNSGGNPAYILRLGDGIRVDLHALPAD